MKEYCICCDTSIRIRLWTYIGDNIPRIASSALSGGPENTTVPSASRMIQCGTFEKLKRIFIASFCAKVMKRCARCGACISDSSSSSVQYRRSLTRCSSASQSTLVARAHAAKTTGGGEELPDWIFWAASWFIWSNAAGQRTHRVCQNSTTNACPHRILSNVVSVFVSK